jgi:GNAT superfamily N-acetyltransferase
MASLFPIRTSALTEFDALCDIDDDASTLFIEAGLDLESDEARTFDSAERQRWRQSVAAGSCWVAIGAADQLAGFVAVSQLDGDPYLQQLSVRRRFMRQGIGTSLIAQVARESLSAGHARLWLTTYSHLSWNCPFYRRCGFKPVAQQDVGPELRASFEHERRYLPDPDRRVIMCRRLVGD